MEKSNLFKLTVLKEVKSLEQKYKRNITKQDSLQELQSDISSRIQILINKIL
tara:strand:+ start:43 stop:198 length:156 start_codon:yes stop_codon:yes gene_type:complete